VGTEGHPVDVEVSITAGLPAFTIVGLPDPSIQEARERVRAAVLAAGEDWPQHRIIVNLSPAHLRKTGSGFDLALAVAVMIATKRIDQERAEGVCLLGELSLDGTIRRVRGTLPAAMAAATSGSSRMIVAPGNAREAAIVRGLEVLPAESVGRVIRFLRGECDLDAWDGEHGPPAPTEEVPDLADVRGNDVAKRALMIAAAGGHNLLMLGAPGGGKTMLARRMPGVLPPMTEEEAFEVTRIHSVAGLLPDDASLVQTRPFRAPHHSGSVTGLVGGGSSVPIPGEVSLAHRGILFMDEYGEFRRETLQALRQPLEDGCVTIVRSRWAVRFPARIQLIAASNPCPCGYKNDPIHPCVCAPGRLTAYQERLTGPIIDRIDLAVHVERLGRSQLFSRPDGETSAAVAERVRIARDRQRARLAPLRIACNAELPPRDLLRLCRVTDSARRSVESAIETSGLSARAAHRVVRVSRTLADLFGDDEVTAEHTDEALYYRVLDRQT
jgi:magnesium chelatase family protein